MKNIIEVKNLEFNFNNVPVLTNINFIVKEGDYVAIAGPNGAGKTTLVRLFLGLFGKNKYSGDVFLFNENLKDFKTWKNIGYLPQRTNDFNQMMSATVQEVVALGLISSKKFPKKIGNKDYELINNSLTMLGILDLKNRPIFELSGGQQQRLFLARAIVNSPKLLVLDEPSTALDPQTREDFYKIVSDLNIKQKTTIILITHDTSSVGHYANKLLYLDRTVVFYGLFSEFCHSQNMEKFFGHFAQHIICHQHK